MTILSYRAKQKVIKVEDEKGQQVYFHLDRMIYWQILKGDREQLIVRITLAHTSNQFMLEGQAAAQFIGGMEKLYCKE